MDTTSLNVFLTVAKEGNISKAAKELNFVQSNVTAKIKQLEADLDSQLFYRHSKGVTPSQAGKTLIEYAHRILHLLEETKKAVQDSPIPKGTLSIGSMETTAAVRLPPILAGYHKQFPEVNLSLTTGPSEYLVQAVLQYDLDGAFVAGPIDHPDLLQQTILEEELVLVTDDQKGEFNHINELMRKPILVFRQGCSYRSRLEAWLRLEGLLPVKVMEFGSLEAILGCVMSGFGISLLPRSVVKDLQSRNSLNCYSLPNDFGKVSTVFIHRKDLFLTSALKRFIDIVHLNATEKGQETEFLAKK
ncbi:LysR family transcriptional regulator [Bacillus sp. V5-8f]|uniref:LysR family transcriptional regulator n=1 Tax=Bacillus sp. V5-8f TaxID=2053044 RepID=UPI000C7611AF|nr:LysR family transcriptional regulator [Bacillus sp. V5-8f]PLT34124.1 LysR family transcriptional regulator [Bacillus sp. V5-8f]